MSILLYNGRVFNTEHTYILINGNRIAKIGNGTLPDATRSYDLNGAEIYPGFCDSHTHLSNIALMHGTLDLTNKSRKDVLQAVREECRRKKRVVGRGWDESFWERKEYLSSEELDEICPDSEVFLVREDGHLAVVNSLTRRKYSLGDEEGILLENEVWKMSNMLDAFKNLDFDFAQRYALSRGVTCVHDFGDMNAISTYFNMHRSGKLDIRIYASFYIEDFPKIKSIGLYSGFGDSFLKIGSLKLFSDGSIGAKTAATEYRDGFRAKPLISSKKLRALVKDANTSGIRVFTHAIGDFAIETVINAYKDTKGNRIEHFELAREEFLNNDNFSVSVQPNFLKWAKRGGLYHRMLGDSWLENNNPFKKINERGIEMLFGSDCMPLDPLFGIKMSTESEFLQQRTSLKEAIQAYTLGSYYMSTHLGKLNQGNIADIVVVKDEKILLTMVDGKIKYMNLKTSKNNF